MRIFDSEDEIHPELRFTGAGILAMANAGPNTNGERSFIHIPVMNRCHLSFLQDPNFSLL